MQTVKAVNALLEEREIALHLFMGELVRHVLREGERKYRPFYKYPSRG